MKVYLRRTICRLRLVADSFPTLPVCRAGAKVWLPFGRDKRKTDIQQPKVSLRKLDISFSS